MAAIGVSNKDKSRRFKFKNPFSIFIKDRTIIKAKRKNRKDAKAELNNNQQLNKARKSAQDIVNKIIRNTSSKEEIQSNIQEIKNSIDGLNKKLLLDYLEPTEEEPTEEEHTEEKHNKTTNDSWDIVVKLITNETLAKGPWIGGNVGKSGLYTGGSKFWGDSFRKRPLKQRVEQTVNKAVETLRQKEAATTIQAAVRGYSAKSDFEKQKAAATKIQAVVRGYSAKSDFEKQKTAATKIQAAVRGKQARNEVDRLRNSRVIQQNTYLFNRFDNSYQRNHETAIVPYISQQARMSEETGDVKALETAPKGKETAAAAEGSIDGTRLTQSAFEFWGKRVKKNPGEPLTPKYQGKSSGSQKTQKNSIQELLAPFKDKIKQIVKELDLGDSGVGLEDKIREFKNALFDKILDESLKEKLNLIENLPEEIKLLLEKKDNTSEVEADKVPAVEEIAQEKPIAAEATPREIKEGAIIQIGNHSYKIGSKLGTGTTAIVYDLQDFETGNSADKVLKVEIDANKVEIKTETEESDDEDGINPESVLKTAREWGEIYFEAETDSFHGLDVGTAAYEAAMYEYIQGKDKEASNYVLKYYEYDENTQSLILERAECEVHDVRRALSDDKTLPDTEKQKIAKAILHDSISAMKFMLEIDCWAGDVKDDNFFLSKDGRIKIADLGYGYPWAFEQNGGEQSGPLDGQNGPFGIEHNNPNNGEDNMFESLTSLLGEEARETITNALQDAFPLDANQDENITQDRIDILNELLGDNTLWEGKATPEELLKLMKETKIK